MNRYRVAGLTGLERVAREFSHGLRAGDVVTLEGELGAGKTTFVAAVVRALGNTSPVTSPTFTFWHRYGGSPPIEHLDLYRVDDPAEAVELGLEEAFGPEGIVFVEWPGRLPRLLPGLVTAVTITGSGDGMREIVVRQGAFASELRI